ncbi:pyruvate formate lyase family protein [Luteococcus sp.]|uniref:pyruvate formate lyase family protein n=1 Tax=Luteococcus sp. TaxID=1969402 RepID=UPI00346198EF
MSVERTKRVLDIDTHTPADIDAFAPGHICETDDVIVGLQTDAPLKRAMMPNGGWRMVETAIGEAGMEPDERVKEIFTKYRKTHNEAVFYIQTPDIRAARSAHIITGLPDAYGRGRIIGDYRRVALYGVDALIAQKQADKEAVVDQPFDEHWARYREDHSEQIKALKKLKTMAASYGIDISGPARTAQEAVQWTYVGYLGSIKSQDGAAMSFGRLSGFFDVYFERDLANGTLTEDAAQEIIDALVTKLRIVRFLRTEDYGQIFSGDPYWATWSDAGLGEDGCTLVTKTSFRLLQTLRNLGPAPEPNITIFWDPKLPQGCRDFCAAISIETSSLQYEADGQIRDHWGDDAAIACCVSPMRVGKQMQFFGARVNAGKSLLHAINGGRDEMTGKQVVTGFEPVAADGPLDFDDVWARYEAMLDWVIGTYVEALNIIHYSHDRYAYEAMEMALHDSEIVRTMGCGIAGLSIVADSLSAIKYAKVTPVCDGTGLVVDRQSDQGPAARRDLPHLPPERLMVWADGISGEYRPEPVELEVPRLRASGRGTAGIDSSGEMSHHEHVQAVREGRLGSMHSWELVTGVDGPGTRMTVFMSGCPLLCLYCHNPDTLFTSKGEPVLLDDLVARLARYRGIFRATKGGLTVSGGEPLQQPAVVGRLLAEAKQLGIHTAIDTSGFLGANCTDEMLGNLDLVLLDIKSGLPKTYRRVTGRELQPTLGLLPPPGRFRHRDLAALSLRSRPDRCRGQCGRRRRARGDIGHRQPGGGASLPPDGAGQVGRTRHGLPAGRRAHAVCRAAGPGARTVPCARDHHLVRTSREACRQVAY